MSMKYQTSFPILDATRGYANTSLGRAILDAFGFVEPLVAEMDTWCAMPLRLVHDDGSGYHLELGPYSLNAADVETLRAAIFAYDDAVGPVRR